MKIEALTDETIIVELSDDDMKNLNITYEEMDYSKVETKRVIWTILSRARRTLGRELDTSGRLFVEAMRCESGGCVLFFSVDREEKSRRKNKRYLVKKGEYITCEFENADVMMNCAKHLYKSCCESRLYSLDNKYRLLVRPLTGAAGVKNCLNEFGKIIGESAMLTEFTDEHWHCLIKEGAVNLLSSGKEAS
ncbi:MAG: adaptor protein MecA [Clostridia bacterium]|nr:adaptor protein MecA [Clostridia bacterium]MBR6619065.1 adaptor protein MecA [Clostridia bacterium]